MKRGGPLYAIVASLETVSRGQLSPHGYISKPQGQPGASQ